MAIVCGDCGVEAETGMTDPRPGDQVQKTLNKGPKNLCPDCYEKAKAEVKE